MTPATTLARALAATHAAAFVTERPWNAAEFAALLAQPTTVLAGDAHSFLLGRVILDEAEVLTLATHPGHRRLGLARAALTAFLAQASSRGATRAFLDVAEDNAPARALYAAAGFAETGRRAGYYAARGGADPVTRAAALILACDLTPGQGCG
jgi:ribosomal-protein-alanine N-acetyltransferase